MTGALFWINVPFTEKKQNKKNPKNFIILYIFNNVFWYFLKHITDLKQIQVEFSQDLLFS